MYGNGRQEYDEQPVAMQDEIDDMRPGWWLWLAIGMVIGVIIGLVVA
jgi:hypothetical protein